MGLFDFLFGDTAAGFEPGEAVVGLLVAAAWADGEFQPEEREAVLRMVQGSDLVPGQDVGALVDRLAEHCQRHGGRALKDLAAHVPEERRTEAYEMCADLVVTDGRLAREESRLLGRLRKALHLSEEDGDRLLGRAAARKVLGNDLLDR